MFAIANLGVYEERHDEAAMVVAIKVFAIANLGTCLVEKVFAGSAAGNSTFFATSPCNTFVLLSWGDLFNSNFLHLPLDASRNAQSDIRPRCDWAKIPLTEVPPAENCC